MQLVVQDESGVPMSSHSDFSLDLQYGDDKSDFVLYIPNAVLKDGQRILVDGTPFGGVVDHLCPSTTPDDGDSISYKGRTVQGVLAAKVICPDAGQSHLVVSGDANRVIESVVSRVGLAGFFEVPEEPSGITVPTYRFNRYVDAYTGLRMMLASCGARLSFTCHDGRHKVEAVGRTLYGGAASEQAYFELDKDCLPVNHLIGLGKGEGAARAVSHWYADRDGEVSQTQTLFGIEENALAYNLNSEEPDELASKTKSKLKEYQTASEADLTLPPGVNLDVGDRVSISHSKFNVKAEAEVVQVVLKASPGVAEVQYKFGVPDYPKDEE